MKHKNETDPEKITMLIARGEYVIKEVEALYMLRKYRTLKQRYYNDEKKWQKDVIKIQNYNTICEMKKSTGWTTSVVAKGP